jgi:hypothetical protein
MIEKRNACGILVGKPEERGNLGGIDVDGRVILKWINLAQHRKNYPASVSMVMNLRVS